MEAEHPRDARTESGFGLGELWITPGLGRIAGPHGEQHVPPRAMDLLVFLAENSGQVKSKDEILDAVWHDVVVADAVVFRHVSLLRRLLGDDSGQPRFIETIPKRGYRLIAPVDTAARVPVSGPTTQAPPEIGEASTSPRPAVSWIAAGVVLLVIAGVGWATTRFFGPSAPSEPPQSSRAHKLYHDSLSIPREPEPNRRAIELLRSVLEIEPTLVPAWESLAERLYLHGTYGGGGKDSITEAEAAMLRAAELDPNSPRVLRRRVTALAERGELAAAYQVARTFLDQHSGQADAHFAMAYVYRYAGLLQSSARECDAALVADPNGYRLRSCALVFYRLGYFERARDFLRLDAGSDWTLHQQGLLELHRKQPQDALASWRKLSQEPWTTIPWMALLDRCLNAPEAPRTQTNLQFSAEIFREVGDPEGVYYGALLMSACSRPDLALSLLEEVTQRGYCAPSAFLSEPAFSTLRRIDGYEAAKRDAISCRDAFRKHLPEE